MARFDLSDTEWLVIEPYCRKKVEVLPVGMTVLF